MKTSRVTRRDRFPLRSLIAFGSSEIRWMAFGSPRPLKGILGEVWAPITGDLDTMNHIEVFLRPVRDACAVRMHSSPDPAPTGPRNRTLNPGVIYSVNGKTAEKMDYIFDQDVKSGWGDGPRDAVYEFAFADGNAYTVNGCRCAIGCTSWTLEGSQDGRSWESICSPGRNTGTSIHRFKNAKAYRKYRIRKKGRGRDNEITLYEYD